MLHGGVKYLDRYMNINSWRFYSTKVINMLAEPSVNCIFQNIEEYKAIEKLIKSKNIPKDDLYKSCKRYIKELDEIGLFKKLPRDKGEKLFNNIVIKNSLSAIIGALEETKKSALILEKNNIRITDENIGAGKLYDIHAVFIYPLNQWTEKILSTTPEFSGKTLIEIGELLDQNFTSKEISRKRVKQTELNIDNKAVTNDQIQDARDIFNGELEEEFLTKEEEEQMNPNGFEISGDVLESNDKKEEVFIQTSMFDEQ